MQGSLALRWFERVCPVCLVVRKRLVIVASCQEERWRRQQSSFSYLRGSRFFFLLPAERTSLNSYGYDDTECCYIVANESSIQLYCVHEYRTSSVSEGIIKAFVQKKYTQVPVKMNQSRRRPRRSQ